MERALAICFPVRMNMRSPSNLSCLEDGEIARSDPDGFASELLERKPAAEFIAKQIRLADVEERDVRPVHLGYLKSQALEESDTHEETGSFTALGTMRMNTCVLANLGDMVGVKRC